MIRKIKENINSSTEIKLCDEDPANAFIGIFYHTNNRKKLARYSSTLVYIGCMAQR